MGGRYCSLVAGDADDPVPCLGLVLLGYPLHAAGQAGEGAQRPLPAPDDAGAVRQRRPATRSPAKPALTEAARKVKGPRQFHWIESADHGFKPLKASGLTVDGVLADVAATVVAWVGDLPG